MDNKAIEINRKLKVYGDKLSQPVRSVLLFCELNNIPYEFINISLAKGEQYSNEEFKQISPLSKVPAISFYDPQNIKFNKTFNLTESCTILRFLSEVYDVNKKWYPKDNIFRRSLIDQFLDWHHSNTRAVFTGAIFKRIMAPKMLQLGGEFAEKAKMLMDTSSQIPKLLDYFNNLLKIRKFIVDDEISIADLIFSCEVYQIIILGYDLTKYTTLWKYLEFINEMPGAKKINEALEKVVASLKKRGAKF